MRKLVVLKLDGHLEGGVRFTLEIGEEGQRHFTDITGKLPPNPDISTQYSSWRSTYRSLGADVRAIKAKKARVDGSPLERLKECHESDRLLRDRLTSWLKSESFRPAREKWLEQLSLEDEVRVLIRTESLELRKLPWHLWDLVEQYHAEVALCAFESKRFPEIKRPSYKGKVRILVILGDSEGIDIEKDQHLLENLPNAKSTFLREPSRQEISDSLWNQQWDILFFAGHSKTEKNSGRIYINPNDSLTIAELKFALKKAINRGLQLAIFNSCDGLGLAWELEKLYLPQMIVMREPVPDRVAQEFLKQFLKAFSNGQSLYLAAREARKSLKGLEDEFPSASWLPTICQNAATVPPRWRELGRRSTNISPYRGLFAFREKDAPFFCGRKAFTQQLLEAVQQQSFVAVIGPSGSGKSSVVFAGLVQKLRQTQKWRVVSFRPGDRPFYALAAALLREIEPKLSPSDRPQKTRYLADLFREQENGLRDEIEAMVWDNPGIKLLLVVDQFEELYTLCRNTEECQVFLDRLLEVRHRTPNFTLVITLRADFLAQALSYRPFADALQYADLKLGPMNRSELEEAIALPAKKLGVQIQAGLTERILDDVSTQPGNLPLLEFALTQLWGKQRNLQLTHAAYEEIGEVTGALALYAEETYEQLNEEEKERAQRIFVQLVHPGEDTEDTRRVAICSELGKENWDLVTRLANARLVVTGVNDETAEETVEIVHEAMIVGWQRLRQWIEEDRRFLTWRERLRFARREWEVSQGDEDALLRGTPLAEAQGWLSERPLEISPAEKAFIGQSQLVRDRQQRRIIVGLTSGLIVALVLAGIAGLFWQRSERERKRAEIGDLKSELRDDVQSVETEYSLNQVPNLDRQWEALISNIKLSRKLQRADREAVEIETWMRTFELLQQAIEGEGFKERNRLEGHPEKVVDVAFSPDGQILASVSGNNVYLWSYEGEKLHILEGHTEPVNRISFSPDGLTIASVSNDKALNLWSIQGRLIKTISSHNRRAYSIQFSPNGEFIASSSLPPFTENFDLKDEGVIIWDREGNYIKSLIGNKSNTNGVAKISFSPDSQFILLAYPPTRVNNELVIEGAVELWNLKGQLIQTLDVSAIDVSFSPDGTIIAVAIDNTVQLWNRNGTRFKIIDNGIPVTSISFSPDGTILASTSSEGQIKLWNTEGEEIQTLNGHREESYRVSFSPDGQTFATASADQTVRLWSYAEPLKMKTHLEGYGRLAENPPFNSLGLPFIKTSRGRESINSVSFSRDNKTIAAASGNAIKIWKIQDEFEFNKNLFQQVFIKVASDVVWTVNMSQCNNKVMLGQHKVLMDNLNDSFKFLGNNFIRHKGQVFSIEFSTDCQIIASGGEDGIVNLWNSEGRLIHQLKGHSDAVTSINFSPDDTMIASASLDKTVKLWGIDGKLIKTFDGHEDMVTSVRFSPDGKIIASASADQTVRLWNLDGTLLNSFQHTHGLNSLSFSPDGKMIAIASNDQTVRLRSTTGIRLKTLEGHNSFVTDVEFSPDGKMLASGGADNQVIVWDLDFDKLLWRICNWSRDYLKTNPNVQQADRGICDDLY